MLEQPKPTVSVIIPVYNGTNFLREAIDSVLTQTFRDFEVLVVDDGSTDDTWNTIVGYDGLVRAFRKRNGGVASALNVGLQQMRGRYFAWLSHDDLWLPGKLQSQVDFLARNPGFQACYTDYFIIDQHSTVRLGIRKPWFPREKATRALFRLMYINGSTMLVERTCFDKVGLFSESLHYTQDAEMWLRLLRYFDIGRVPEKLAKKRLHSEQASSRLDQHRAEAETMFSDIFGRLGVATLFPHLADRAREPEIVAMAQTWFAHCMSVHHQAYRLADEHYLLALRAWPSWRNPAYLGRLCNRIQPVVHGASQRARLAMTTALRCFGLRSRLI